MKRMKKVLAALVMACMLCPALSMVVYAAPAELRFTDPSTTVGAEVEVTAKLSAQANVQSFEATLTYDSSMLKFQSGDQATGGDGTITLTGNGSGSSMEFVLKFQALAEGTTKIEVSNVKGTDTSPTAMQITKGSSAVTIGPGDPSLITEEPAEGETPAASGEGPQVEVDGVSYTISGGFSDALIPEGFVRGEVTFEGTTCEVITQEASGESAMYLAPAAGGDADFFMYNSEEGTFAPFEEVEIAQGRYLIMLRDDGSVKVPKEYQETTLTLNGKEFTAWQNTENADYYMVYALNADGKKALYQYDTVDKTYQRYNKAAASVKTAEENTSSPKGIWGKVLGFVEDFLDIVVILAGIVLLVLVIVLIVVAVKLRHRNLELDDLYDEYGIDLEEEETQAPNQGRADKKAGGAKNKPAVRTPVETTSISLDDEDDFEAFDDYDEEFDDYEDDFDDYDDYEAEGYDYDDEPEDLIEDLDDLLSSQPSKKRGHMEEDDTFKVDFIDID